ncbi:MAG: cytidylate kinase family protein [Deltaproteobacteria bacterium]|jgi:cytidylate kinase|nr:cytidylate kinase family protein [Deltaproteobacteria bacterium]
MLITITGKLGSGKSTVCEVLSKRHRFEVFSSGSIQRNLAKSMNLDTLAFNQLMTSDPSFDHLIDEEVKRLSKAKKNERLIFDSRLAWHFVEKSFKVFLSVDPTVAATRVMFAGRGPEENYANAIDAREKLKLRSRLEITRFKEIYGVDLENYSHFDLVIDTTWLDSELAASLIYDSFESFKAQKFFSPRPVIVLSPKSLYPTSPLKVVKVDLDLSDNFCSRPLKVLVRDGYFFLINDDGSWAAALSNKLNYVRAVPGSAEDAAKANLSLDVGQAFSLNSNWLKKVEQTGSFLYPSAPEAFGTLSALA